MPERRLELEIQLEETRDPETGKPNYDVFGRVTAHWMQEKMPMAADPRLFFKSFGWYQWSKKHNLPESVKETFRLAYEAEFREYILDAAN